MEDKLSRIRLQLVLSEPKCLSNRVSQSDIKRDQLFWFTILTSWQFWIQYLGLNLILSQNIFVWLNLELKLRNKS